MSECLENNILQFVFSRSKSLKLCQNFKRAYCFELERSLYTQQNCTIQNAWCDFKI